MARNNKGIVFLLLGFLLLLIAGGWYIYNVVEDNNAGQNATEILNKIDDVQNSDGEDNVSVITVDGDDFCGKVIIEKLNIELPVYNEWSYKRLKTAPCRYAGSIHTNDIVIAAHNYKSHFGPLNKLNINDEIKFLEPNGKIHTYKVCELTTLDGTAVSDMQSGTWDFTLFTCTKSGKQRITVRCELKE